MCFWDSLNSALYWHSERLCWSSDCSLIPLHTWRSPSASLVSTPSLFLIVILLPVALTWHLDQCAHWIEEPLCQREGTICMGSNFIEVVMGPEPSSSYSLSCSPSDLPPVSLGRALLLGLYLPISKPASHSLGKLFNDILSFFICKMVRAKKQLRDTWPWWKLACRINWIEGGPRLSSCQSKRVMESIWLHIVHVHFLWLWPHKQLWPPSRARSKPTSRSYCTKTNMNDLNLMASQPTNTLAGAVSSPAQGSSI